MLSSSVIHHLSLRDSHSKALSTLSSKPHLKDTVSQFNAFKYAKHLKTVQYEKKKTFS